MGNLPIHTIASIYGNNKYYDGGRVLVAYSPATRYLAYNSSNYSSSLSSPSDILNAGNTYLSYNNDNLLAFNNPFNNITFAPRISHYLDSLKADKLNNSNDYNNTYSTLQNQFDDFKLITKDEFKTFFAAINFNLNPAKWIIKNNFIQPAIAYTSGRCANNYHVDALSSVSYLSQTYNYGHHYRKGSGGGMASSMGCSFYDYTSGRQYGDGLYCVLDLLSAFCSREITGTEALNSL